VWACGVAAAARAAATAPGLRLFVLWARYHRGVAGFGRLGSPARVCGAGALYLSSIREGPAKKGTRNDRVCSITVTLASRLLRF